MINNHHESSIYHHIYPHELSFSAPGLHVRGRRAADARPSPHDADSDAEAVGSDDAALGAGGAENIWR